MPVAQDIELVARLLSTSTSPLPMAQTQEALMAWGRIVAALKEKQPAEKKKG